MKKVLLAVAAAVSLSFSLAGGAQAQTLLSYWNFNNDSSTYTSATTTLGAFAETNGQIASVVTTPNATPVYSGASASLDVSELFGVNPVSGGSTAINGDWGVFSDSGINRVSGDSSVGGSLMVAGSNFDQKSIVFTLDSAGYSNLKLTFAGRATASGTNPAPTEVWSYSLDGSTWFSAATITPGSAFAAQTLNLSGAGGLGLTALDNQGVFYLKLTYNQAGGGTSTLDNVQLLGTAVPEPPAAALLLGGALLLVLLRARRLASD